ncbi:MAG: methyl-accepting chemotaxis protein [Dokdonella sp.]
MSTTGGAAGRGGGRANTVLFALLGILFVIAIVNFVFLYLNNRDDRKAISYTTQIQVLSQQLAKYASEAVGGNELAFQELESTRSNIDTYVQALNNGDKTGMHSFKGELPNELDALTKAWTQLQGDAKKILDSKDVVLNATTSAKDFTDKLSGLNSRMSEVVNILTDKNASASQVYIASRQMQLADRMGGRVTKILAGGADTQSSAAGLDRDSRLYQTVVMGLMNGAAELNIKPLDNANAKQIVTDVATQWTAVGEPVKNILDAATILQEVKDSADASFTDSLGVLTRAGAVASRIDALPNSSARKFVSPWVGVVAAALATLLLLFLGFNLFRDQQRRYQQTTALNQRNQDAILRLLDEMGSLAEGDLTVKATVTEDITGAIADSVNFAVEALRSLVTTINETAVQVSAAAQETQGTAMHLAEAAQHQARQITSASAAIKDMASSIDNVSKNSIDSAEVAQRSVQIAANGAQVVRQTIQGMDSIRDQIQETSKRIKRLGESSQEIGSIVELINDLAEQTNILALNAAIQAASAGEAGRGFAVVADEVQRLAERASGATKRIETLVQTIQSDTNEAVSSMEQTTSEVVSGARLAEDAGHALGEIETVSNNLAGLIQGISTSARQQSAAATNISATMNVIQEITSQTSVGASQTAESIGNLAQLASDLRRSVADFKLPG